MYTPHYTHSFGKAIVLIFCALILAQCTDESLMIQTTVPDVTISSTSTTTTTISPESCASCTYVVPTSSTGTSIVDGKVLNLQPGSVICLNSQTTYGSIIFRNIVGTGAAPIIITNCGGTAVLNATGMGVTMKTEYSKFFRIKGGTGTSYGIKLTGGHMGLSLEKLSTNFEVNNLEICNVGFAGIIAKTDPTCDDATIRGNFVMRNVMFHDNYIHDTGGEGMYIGNSFYENGMSRECGMRLPHTIEGLKVYNNRLERTGWEAIQVGCAISGAYVYKNKIESYGCVNRQYQNNGIQFSEGTKGICYRNSINKGPGIGINVVGYGDSYLYDNIISNTGSFGIFCDERATRNLPGFQIINNTIINPGVDGIRMYNEYVPAKIYNNIIVKPGNYALYVYPRSASDSYVYKLAKTIPVDMKNNIFTQDINSLQFRDVANQNYRLNSTSPAVDTGTDITEFAITHDYYGGARLKGAAFDIGASEY